jgi:hypothetical protein
MPRRLMPAADAAFKHGTYTQEARQQYLEMRELIREAWKLLRSDLCEALVNML